MNTAELKQAIEAKQLLCFADDVLARTKTVEETEEIIRGINKL
jgi:hypothetical protein